MTSQPTNLPGIPGTLSSGVGGAGAASARSRGPRPAWLAGWVVAGLAVIVAGLLIAQGVLPSPLPNEPPALVLFALITLGILCIDVGIVPRVLVRFARAVPVAATVVEGIEELGGTTKLRVRYLAPTGGTVHSAEVPAARLPTEPGAEVMIYVDPTDPDWATSTSYSTMRKVLAAFGIFTFVPTFIGLGVMFAFA